MAVYCSIYHSLHVTKDARIYSLCPLRRTYSMASNKQSQMVASKQNSALYCIVICRLSIAMSSNRMPADRLERVWSHLWSTNSWPKSWKPPQRRPSLVVLIHVPSLRAYWQRGELVLYSGWGGHWRQGEIWGGPGQSHDDRMPIGGALDMVKVNGIDWPGSTSTGPTNALRWKCLNKGLNRLI